MIAWPIKKIYLVSLLQFVLLRKRGNVLQGFYIIELSLYEANDALTNALYYARQLLS